MKRDNSTEDVNQPEAASDTNASPSSAGLPGYRSELALVTRDRSFPLARRPAGRVPQTTASPGTT